MIEEKNGLLFNQEDEYDFHQKVSRFLSNEKDASRMAAEGNRLTIQEYDTAILSRRIKALYEELRKEKAQA